MKKLNEFKGLIAEARVELTSDVLMAMSNPTGKQKVGAGVIAGSGAVLGSTMSFFAADFLATAKSMMSEVYGWILAISTGLMAIAIALAFIAYGLSTDPQAARMAKDRIFRILKAWVGVNLIGVIATTIVSLTSGGQFAGQGTTDTF